MNKKLIMFDIDGTILAKRKISQKTVEAIAKARELGHTVSLASGRNSQSMYFLAEILKLNDNKTPIVGLNGAEVFTVDQEGKVTYLWEKAFPKEVSEKVIALTRQHHVDFFAYTSNLKTHYVGRILSLFSIAMSIARRVKITKVKKDFSNLNDDVKKFLIYGKQKRMQDFVKDVQPFDFSIFTWSEATDPKANIELNMGGIDKVVGVQEVAKLLGFDQKDVIFFGDGDNDVAALKWAGVGVAMGNAYPGVAEHANEQTLTVEDDGVAHWLEQNLIGKEA